MDSQSSDLEDTSSNLQDPFPDFSLLSLFPRTFNHCDLHPDRNSLQTDPLEDVRPLLDSMALKNPNTLMEQAKSVLERLKVDNLESTRGEEAVGDLGGVIHENLQGQVEDVENVRGEDTLGDLRGENHENLQGRRPALGRKRARFSFKLNSSQSIECLEPDVDIDKFPDPEEFFSAFEKHENAKKELRRQNGGALMDLDQNVPHMADRRRRPGLSRKSASYKHRFSMAPSGDDKIFLSSQEELSQDLCSPTPSNYCLQTENTDKIPVPSTREISGPVAAGKDRPDDISGEDKDDESDDIIGMLKMRFKPIEINKSCLSDLDSVLQSEFKIFGESLQDSPEKMSDLHGILSAIGKETTLGCNNNMERSSGHPSTSLTPPKSPYSSISLLKARLYQSRQEKDRFSALDIDLSPPGKAASSKDTMHIGSGHAVGDNDTREANPNENECNFASKDTQDLAAANFTSSEKSISSDSMMPAVLSDSIEHMELDHDIVEHGEREANPNENECNFASKDTHDLAAANFTSSEKSMSGDSMMPAVLSDSIEHMELDHDIVEHGERDVNPKSPLLENESDTNHTMETVKDGLKTSGAFSDGVAHIELYHATRRDQSPKTAAHEKESNLVHIKNVPDLDAENIAPSKETMKDNSTISGIADTTPHVELGNDIMVNDTRGRVLEDNPCETFDDAVNASDQHIGPDDRVEEEDIRRNMENSSRNKEQPTTSTVEDLEKDRHSSDHGELPTEGVIGDLDHDRPSSSQAQPLSASSKTTEDKSRKEQEPSHEQPPAERRIAKAARKYAREIKECSRRKSLAACGTRWETGTRRSTRIRTRPLEFWKGERQLYGRIHESLITVVGTKYFSPSKGAGQATLKVKSYVSDEYLEIVERAALH